MLIVVTGRHLRQSCAPSAGLAEPLAPSHAPVWIDPEWRTRQRPGEPRRRP